MVSNVFAVEVGAGVSRRADARRVDSCDKHRNEGEIGDAPEGQAVRWRVLNEALFSARSTSRLSIAAHPPPSFLYSSRESSHRASVP